MLKTRHIKMTLKVGGDASSSSWGIGVETVVSSTGSESESDLAKVTPHWASLIRGLLFLVRFYLDVSHGRFQFRGCVQDSAGTQTRTGGDGSGCAAVGGGKGNDSNRARPARRRSGSASAAAVCSAGARCGPRAAPRHGPLSPLLVFL